jgi:hypothetical protein
MIRYIARLIESEAFRAVTDRRFPLDRIVEAPGTSKRGKDSVTS